jgi:arginine decarboxylase
MRRERVNRKESTGLTTWSGKDSAELYGIERWGKTMFAVNEQGHVSLSGGGGEDIDLKALVDEIRLRGVEPPVLIRFTDILRLRLDKLARAFDKAIADYDYKGLYRGVYPIKVNQHRHVLEDIVQLGRKHHWGLECGSKPELILAIALHNDPDAVVICNGFKDHEYVQTALFARRLGMRIFLVIEKPSELRLVLDAAKQMSVEPLIGLRIKLSSRGKGLWEASGGDKSKFGLRADEIIEVVQILRRRRMLGALQLVHWHLGSQISDVQAIKDAMKEGARFFVELHRLGASISYVDTGGGLAVDYDGSQTNFASSTNYTEDEYAAGVVGALHAACEEAELPHPTIVTEAGRSLVAHHAVLVLEAIGTSCVGRQPPPEATPPRAPDVVRRMAEILTEFTGKNFQEAYHDALETRRDALLLFNLGHLSLKHRAIVETYFWEICKRIHAYTKRLAYVPDDMEGLGQLLCTTYYCNFSLFQSLPDHWAIKQIFPVTPLHRLNERPENDAVLADITCDSDGAMNHFADLRDVRQSIPLHPLIAGEPYYIGVFLVGAYQEILGDLHNLFGDTNVVHVSAGRDGYVIDKTVEGESIADVLDYVLFDRRYVLAKVRQRVEGALQQRAMRLQESAPFMRQIEQSLDEYTYYRMPSPADGHPKSR